MGNVGFSFRERIVGVDLHFKHATVESVRAAIQSNPKRLEEKRNLEVNQFVRPVYLTNCTPLLAACVNDKWELASCFIELGADVNAADGVSILIVLTPVNQSITQMHVIRCFFCRRMGIRR